MYKVKDIQRKTHLKQVPLFSSFDDEQIDILSKTGIVKKFTKGCLIVNQDDHGDTLYIVISGNVKVSLLNEDGKEIVLSFLKEGDFFGELSLLDDEPRSASIIVVEDAALFLLTRGQFYQLITSYPVILKKVIKEICARLRRADEKIKSLAFFDVYERTIRVLQQLARDRGMKTKNGIEVLQAPTHQELSTIVGTSRETITRIIKVLKKDRSLVSYKGRRVVLRDR